MASKIGNRRYLHSTALGKALLSGLPEKEIIRLIRLKRLPRLTPNTITTQGALLAEVESVRERGFALDNEENELNGRCIAAPVLGAYSRVVAALSISAPAFRLDVAGARSLAGDLIEACRAISKGITG
jgi:DNA-binding IclR family transcriptional regulator